MTLTIKEHVNRRLQGMIGIRKDYEAEAKAIAGFTMPARSRFLSGDKDKRRSANSRLNNSHGIFAFRTLQGGMTSGLTSGSRPWMSLQSGDERLNENAEVKNWLAVAERLMYSFWATTNFYSAVKTGYLEMGAFGTEACVAVEHPTEGMVFHQLTFGEYWIAPNSALQVGALTRRCDMTVRQAVEQFKDSVSPWIRNAYDGGRYEEPVTAFHAIEENPDYVEGRLGNEGKLWRSVYWDEKCDRETPLLSLSGYEEQPFWAPRWDTTGGDVWGTGPGHDALPDLKELQLQTKRKAEATDFHVYPEQVASSKVALKRQPKSVVSVAGSDISVEGLVSVPYQIPYQTIGVIGEDVQRCKETINQATYADLFMAITNMQGIQPRNMEEIASRNEEKLTQLGPVIERVNNEKLEVAIERTFGVMQRGGLLPPAPEALRDQPDLKIEFVSILTTMQRMVGLGQIERVVGFVGNLAATYPEARHKLNPMEIVDEYARRAGATPSIIRPTEEAQGIADQEAQAAQQAQQAEMASKAAPAAQVGVDAARLLSESSDAMPAVEQLVPLLPR